MPGFTASPQGDTAHDPSTPRRRTRRNAGFTLVEVILAIGISVGLLVVALVFYQQAADLRNQLIQESERLSALRLIFDRISTDLRVAFAQPQIGFTGTTDSMTFLVSRAPDLVPGRPGAPMGPASDLRRVSYMLTAALEGTNFVVTGLDRTEEPLLNPIVATTAAAASGPATFVSAPEPAVPPPGTPAAATSPNPGASALGGPLADNIRFVRFRYWDGSAWLEGWDSPDLPAAVEINLGADPLPTGELPDAYPYERFRRVVHLPARAGADDWWAGL